MTEPPLTCIEGPLQADLLGALAALPSGGAAVVRELRGATKAARRCPAGQSRACSSGARAPHLR